MYFEDEPMDVDLSSNSIRNIDAMDISYNDLNSTPRQIKIKEEPFETNHEDVKENSDDKDIYPVQPTTVVKRFYIQRKNHKSSSIRAVSVVLTILSLVTLLIYHIVKFDCSRGVDLEELKKSLTRNLIGQSEAIEDIVESLEEKSSSKILFFYGGTGVGKTLTVSLILENLHEYANIYHYTMPSFINTFSADLMLGLIFCPISVIIVDDLNSTDMHINEHIKKVIEKSENLDKNITVILVFNCDTINDQYVKNCDNSFSADLQKAFKDIKVSKHFIKFKSLSDKHLRRCIEKELGGKTLSEEEFNMIVKNFNVTVDGCKGVYTKIKFLNLT